MSRTAFPTAAAVAALLCPALTAAADPVPLADLIGSPDGMVVGDKHFTFQSFGSTRFSAADIMVEAVENSGTEHGFRLIQAFDDPGGDPSPSDGYLTFSVRSMTPGANIRADHIRFGASTGEPGSWVRLNEHVFDAEGGNEILSRTFLAEGGRGEELFERVFDHLNGGRDFLRIEQDVWIFSAPDGAAVAHFMERTFETVGAVPLPSAALLGGAGLLGLSARRRRPAAA
jgi:hypothetical protein